MTDKGITDKVKGNVKEKVGDVTNNNDLKAEGIMDKAEGKAKEVASNIKDAASDVKDKVEDLFKKK